MHTTRNAVFAATLTLLLAFTTLGLFKTRAQVASRVDHPPFLSCGSMLTPPHPQRAA